MVDHLFAETALLRLTDAPLRATEGGRVLVDCRPGESIDVSDATKVRLDGQRVTAIGKGLDPWDAIDAGCFVLTAAIQQGIPIFIKEIKSHGLLPLQTIEVILDGLFPGTLVHARALLRFHRHDAVQDRLPTHFIIICKDAGRFE